MENKEFVKQMIALNKTAFDNSFRAMATVYEQNEKNGSNAENDGIKPVKQFKQNLAGGSSSCCRGGYDLFLNLL
jgi:hypothetical protein